MFDRLIGLLKGKQHQIRMPEVEPHPDLEALFARARESAAGGGEQPPGATVRHVVVVTPGRLIAFQPCPEPGSMPERQVATVEGMIPARVKRNVVAIACTEPAAPAAWAKTIPFFGILIGLAYIGHSVWVFEGHPSALAAGCRGADVLIVDGAMVPWLQQDWVGVARGAMRTKEICVHDRATYSLERVP